jgi:hypothetical protein
VTDFFIGLGVGFVLGFVVFTCLAHNAVRLPW